MAKFKIADFYYGSVLSMLFNNDIVPALVEGNDDRQIYDLITNDGEYRLFMKYRAKSRLGTNGYRSWQFTFTPEDIVELFEFISEDRNLLMALICGEEGLGDSELAVLDREDIAHCFGGGKTSLTISRAKGEKAFRISVGGGREQAIKIPSNRLVG